jgi:hypothetical protein
MDKELLEMAQQWKKTALEMLEKSESGSRSEMVNQMLFACAEMLESNIAGRVGPATSPKTAYFTGRTCQRCTNAVSSLP